MVIPAALPPGQFEELFESSALLACHPDDEILWFSSILRQVPKLIVAFVESRSAAITRCRMRTLAAHPKSGFISLGLREASVFGLGGKNPIPSPYGIEIPNAAISAAYRSNYHRLIELLRPLLSECRNVFTHGPWGEYGHPEHIQVHRAVCQLQQEYNFRLWFTNYSSKRAERLRARIAPSIRIARRVILPTDLELARRLQRLYVQNGCWTWYLSYRWPQTEELLAVEPGSPGGPSAAEYAPVSLNRLLTAADRIRWTKAAVSQAFGASPTGAFIAALASLARNIGGASE